MTIHEAKEEIPTISKFIATCCDNCKSNDWYCPTLCFELEKARLLPFDKIQQAYARHDGDLRKVCRYIKNFNYKKYIEQR